MKKGLLIFMMFLSFGIFVGCQNTEDDGRLKVAVSIIPQAAFVEAVGKDLVNVTTIIPVGFSPESYEPNARQIVNINKVSVYFTIGVPAESSSILPELKNIKIVHLEEIVSEHYHDLYFSETEDESGDHDEHDHSHYGRDPHIWLSIKRVEIMVQAIADELSIMDPDNQAGYKQNALDYINKLAQADLAIEANFQGKSMRTFIVYHPSYGYFANDYNLNMLALEEDGKEPSMVHLTNLIDFAKENNIRYIYHQIEIDSEQVRTFTRDINGSPIVLNPLSYNYIDMMVEMSRLISEGLS